MGVDNFDMFLPETTRFGEDAFGFSDSNWDSLVSELVKPEVNEFGCVDMSFDLTDTVGYSHDVIPHFPISVDSSFTLPVEKACNKKFLLPTKDMELKMSTEEFDAHVQKYISIYGRLSDAQAQKIKEQRKRIRNRESANISRKKKKNQQQIIRQENKNLREENETLKQQLKLVQEELALYKNRLCQTQAQPPDSKQDQFQKQNQQFQIQLQQKQLQKQEQQQQIFSAEQEEARKCIQQIQRSDFPPQEEAQSFPSLQQQQRLWRLNNHSVTVRPFVITSFVILFTFIIFIPFLPSQSQSFSPTISTNLTRGDFHGKKVTLNANSQSIELIPTNSAFPSFHAGNMIGGGGRALLMMDDISPNDNTTSSVSSAEDTEYYVIENEYYLEQYDSLTYVLLVQSPEDIEKGNYQDDYIDLIIPSQQGDSVIHLTSKIIAQEMQFIPGSSTFFPSISDNGFTY